MNNSAISNMVMSFHSHDLPPSLLVTLSLGWIVRDQFVVSGGAPKEGIEVCYKDHCTPALAR